jgi:hypothetical protein
MGGMCQTMMFGQSWYCARRSQYPAERLRRPAVRDAAHARGLADDALTRMSVVE